MSADVDLIPTIDAFLADADEVRHVDRHVVEFGTSRNRIETNEDMESACERVVAMMRDWTTVGESHSDVYLSVPVAIIDDEWVARAINATPPHVYVLLAKHREGLSEAVAWNERVVPSAGVVAIDLLLSGDLILSRVEAGDSVDEGGAWLIRERDPDRG